MTPDRMGLHLSDDHLLPARPGTLQCVQDLFFFIGRVLGELFRHSFENGPTVIAMESVLEFLMHLQRGTEARDEFHPFLFRWTFGCPRASVFRGPLGVYARQNRLLFQQLLALAAPIEMTLHTIARLFGDWGSSLAENAFRHEQPQLV
jgi:hypothetical protein